MPEQRLIASRLVILCYLLLQLTYSANANEDPALGTVPELLQINELTEARFDVTATDADPGSTLTFSIEAIDGKEFPTGATLTPIAMVDGVTFSWIPTESQITGTTSFFLTLW